MRILLLTFMVLAAFLTEVHAQDKAATPAVKAKKSGKVTEVNFEDLLVQGKYHFSDEAIVTVEQDKVLDALLGVRTDFKDRIEQSATRF